MLYDQYMQSDSWRSKRAERLVIDGHKCRMCAADDQLEVHHRPDSYRLIPNESVQDHLTTLCSECHEAITNIIRSRRYAAREIETTVIKPRELNYASDAANGLEVIGPFDMPQRIARESDVEARQANEDHHEQTSKNRCGLYSISPNRVYGVALHER